MKRFYNLKISAKLITGFIVVALITGVMGVYAIVNLKGLDNSDTELYTNMTVPISELGLIFSEFQETRIQSRDVIRATSDQDINEHIQKILDSRKTIKTLSERFEKTILSTEMRTYFDDFIAAREVYVPEIDKVIALARENKDEEAYALLSDTGTAQIASSTELDLINKMVQMKIDDAKQKEDANTKQASFAILVMSIIIIAVMSIAILFGYIISKIISEPIKKALNMINEMKKGHFKIRLNLNTKDEVGQMGTAMDGLADALQQVVIGGMNNIVKGNVDVDIVPVDEEDEIAPAMKKTIETIRELGKEVNKLINAAVAGKLDVRGDVASFDGGWKEIILGVNKLVEAIEKPVHEVTEAMIVMSEGKLGISVNGDYKGEFKVLSDSVNTTAGGLNSVVRKMSHIIGEISQGNLEKITDDYYGDFNEIKINLNNCIDNINGLVVDVNMLSNEAIDGNFDTRADANKHYGEFKKVIDGVNGTLDTIVDKVVWYEAILDAIPFPLHVTDNEMNWMYMNKAFEETVRSNGGIRDRKGAYGLACSHAGANICNTENCGIKQLLKGKPQTFFEWNGKSNKQDTAYLKNKKGEKIGYMEIVTDLTSIIRVSDYTKTEVKRLENNLILLSKGDTDFDINIKEADEYTVEVKEQFEGISNSLKAVKSAVDDVINDASELSEAAVQGKLDARANATQLNGEFRKIVEGINELVEAIAKPVKEVTLVMNEMSKENLQVSVSGSYNGEFAILADSVNNTIDSLNDVLAEINTASQQVTVGSTQVSDGSQELSEGATEQASAIEELTSSITEVAAQTEENASNANQASELALKVKTNAEQGNAHMSEMLKAMGEINESSANISKIIKVIDEIAFQTNILALNAAVEAARAGQHGKGFAVVAEEVRNLAARSANAAKETTDLIEGSIKKAERGTEIANETAKALYQIVEGVSKAATLVSEIAASSNEQASGISQINIGIEQVSEVVQANSATAEESAATSEELSSQAELLRDMVGKFKLKNGNYSAVRIN